MRLSTNFGKWGMCILAQALGIEIVRAEAEDGAAFRVMILRFAPLREG